MKLRTKISITIIGLLIYALGGSSYPLIEYYQDKVYEQDRAKELGIPVITSFEFKAMIEG